MVITINWPAVGNDHDCPIVFISTEVSNKHDISMKCNNRLAILIVLTMVKVGSSAPPH